MGQKVSSKSNEQHIGVDFEIYGRVQHVHFRMYTAAKALKLGVRGWCMNTLYGTVIGFVEGPRKTVHRMMKWLSTKGSPLSRIDRAVFGEEMEGDSFVLDHFTIRPTSNVPIRKPME